MKKYLGDRLISQQYQWKSRLEEKKLGKSYGVPQNCVELH